MVSGFTAAFYAKPAAISKFNFVFRRNPNLGSIGIKFEHSNATSKNVISQFFELQILKFWNSETVGIFDSVLNIIPSRRQTWHQIF